VTAVDVSDQRAAGLERLHLRFRYSEVRPRLAEIGLVLGYPGGELPEVVADAAGQIEARGEALWSIEGGCLVYPGLSVDRGNHQLTTQGIAFEVGKIVGGQLSRATALAVFLCTAGRGIEELSRGLMAGGDPFTGYVADCMGSLVVEAAMDRIHDALEHHLAARGLRITNRYSPGYCEWHVSEQQKLFRLLPPGYCGVSLTDTSLMRPVKSVSGFIGVGPQVRRAPYTCSLCDLHDCLYRRLAGERGPAEAHG
jgi:hypothetical protein